MHRSGKVNVTDPQICWKGTNQEAPLPPGCENLSAEAPGRRGRASRLAIEWPMKVAASAAVRALGPKSADNLSRRPRAYRR